MVLQDSTLIGTYQGYCCTDIVTDTGTEEEFEEITGIPVEEFDIDEWLEPPSGVDEDEIIHRVLKQSDDTYLLHSGLVEEGMNQLAYYAVYRID